MTQKQELLIRGSEIRERLNTISGLSGDAITDEVRAESDALGTEYRDVEFRLRAAVAAEETDPPVVERRTVEVDAEERERRALAARVGMAPFIAAASQGLAVSGEARELSDAYGAAGHTPLSLLGNVDRARPKTGPTRRHPTSSSWPSPSNWYPARSAWCPPARITL